MEVSRSGYYKFLKRTHQKQVDKDFKLLSQVRHIHQKSRGTYGSRRMVKSLQTAGYPVGRFRVRSLMKKAGLSVKRPRKFKRTTDSRHNLPVAPNLLNQQFQVDQPDSIWCGDITYSPSIAHFVVFGQPRSDIVAYESLLSQQSPDPFPCHSVQEDDTACLIYTSGTTGYPKGAMITHANITTPLTDRYTIGKGTLLLNVPMYHIAGVVSTLLPLYRGDTQILLTQFDTGMFLDIVERDKVASTYLVPTMLQGILDHSDFKKKDLSSLRHIGYGASPMPVKLLMRAKELLKVDFTNYFGLTESTGIVSVLTPEDHRLEGSPEEVARKTRRLTGIGRSIPEGEVRIVDDQDQEVPKGTVGEIVARGKKS